MTRTHFRSVCAALLLAFSVVYGHAQLQTANLTGTVTDSAGAAIPGATVTISDPTRGITQTVTSNDQGQYTIPLLQPGENYVLKVTKPGFKETVQNKVILQVAQSAKIDVAMSVGEVSESVNVSSAPPLLDTQTSSLGQVITGETVEALPLNGRSTFRLVQLTPGVYFSPSAYGQFGDVPVNTTWDTNFSINGGRLQSNEILIDGVSSAVGFFNQITTLPSVDDTQEFKVESSNLPATYGHYSGGVVNVSTKSGTNAWHGSAFEFLRNSWLDANDWFNKKAGLARLPFKMNQFGGTLGGPVFKNRTFFFLDYQGTRRIKGAPFTGTVPTQAQRDGNFNGVASIYNPFSTHVVGTVNTRDQFTNNQIPANMIDPVAKAILNYYPLPNQPGNTNNYVSGASIRLTQDQFSTRIDQKVTQKYSLFGRYAWSYTPLTQPNQFGNIADNKGAVGTTPFTNQSFTFDNTYAFSPTLLLTVDYGFARWYQKRYTLSYGFDNGTLGFPSSLVSAISIPMFPAINIASYTGLANQSVLNNGNDAHTIVATVTKIMGRHTLIGGVDGRLHRINYFSVANSGGSYSFAVAQTQGPNANSTTSCATKPCGNAFASFLLGVGSSGNMPLGTGVALQNMYGAVFIQDNWRVTPRLTLNLGVRYDGESPYVDRHNRLNYFDTDVASPAANPSFPQLKGGLQFAGVGSTPRNVYTRQKNNIAPRIGASFSPNPTLVLRGGFGIAYAPLEISDNAVGFSPSLGYASATAWNTFNGILPQNLLKDPFPQGLVQPSGNSLGAATQLGQNISVWTKDAKTPTSYQWNADVQQQFPGAFLLDLGYSGSHGLHLTGPYQLNQLDPTYFSLGTQLTQQVPNPFKPFVSIGNLSNPTVTRQQLLLPYPQFLSVMEINRNWGSSVYHSAQVKVVRRATHGTTLLASYTWSKWISDVNAQLSPIGGNNNTGPQNYYDLRAERSLSEVDVPHNLVINSTSELPFGRGKRFGSHANGVTSTLISGWKINGIFTAQSGQPLTFDGTATGGANRVNLVPGVDPVIHGKRSNTDIVNAYFNTAAFANPAAYTYGTVKRTYGGVRGPGLVNLDASLVKSTRFFDRISTDLRAEMFNVTNTPHFGLPNTSRNAAAFGTITGVRNSPPAREIQVALKIKF
ncbi:MAG: TonB-dependent receptor [Acidobacteria bacterium]|nr:TonB-dependent receptor [Acidobacteriota bacterium]